MSHASNVYFLPGLLEDADAFQEVMGSLGDVATCSVADLTRAATVAQLARDAIDQAPAGALNLVGHSMGGYVAFEILRAFPERVARLALLNTNARADSPEASENRRRLMAVAERDFEAAFAALLPKQMTREHLANPDLTARIASMANSIGKEAFKRQQQAIIARPDSRPGLAKIACPTLVVASREDVIMPLELLEEIARGIPGARLAIVEDSGHVSTLEQPEEVTRLLRDWLAA
jgi:pimeloyl-ACP methyl ester carboxylesterase